MTSAANTHAKDKFVSLILDLWTASTKRKRLYGSGPCIQVCDCYISTLVTWMLFTQ